MKKKHDEFDLVGITFAGNAHSAYPEENVPSAINLIREMTIVGTRMLDESGRSIHDGFNVNARVDFTGRVRVTIK